METEDIYCAENPYWRIAAASARGTSHISQQKPCQDAFAVRVAENGWLTVAVADGAGSAECSQTGASVVVETITGHLTEEIFNGDAIHNASMGDAFRRAVEVGIQKARRCLAELRLGELTDRDASDPELAEILGEGLDSQSAEHIQDKLLRRYHATVVGAVVGPRGGVFFHIGDGVAVASRSNDLASYVISQPRNGENAEETYFFTERDWKDNLRLEEFGPEYDLLVLMSDGAMVFAVAPKLQGLHPPFIAPVNKFMRENWTDAAGQALKNTLDSEQARNLTTDDKTLVWILRQPSS